MKKKKSISLSIVISIATLMASFLTSFLFVKFLLSRPQIGDVNYGLKTTADSFISFVSVFTFGMSSTFIRFHKKYSENESSVISSFNVITLIISGIAIIFGLVLVILASNNLILDPSKGIYSQQQVHDFILILIISISFLALSVLLGNSKWFLESNKKIVFVRLINFIVVFAYPVISIPFVLAGANMVAVTLIYAIVYLTGFFLYVFYRFKIVKSFSFVSVKNVKKEMVKEIIIFSFFVIISCCVETFNYSIDKLILTISFNAALTTVYQLGVTLNQVLLSLSDVIYAPFLPYLAEDIKNENSTNIQKNYDKVNFLLLIISFLLLVGFVSCGKEFVYLWVGEGKELVYYFTIITFCSWPLYGMVKFSTALHRLAGKHIKSSLIYVASLILHLAVTFSLVYFIGPWACVIGTSLSMIFIGLCFISYNKKILNIEQKSYLGNLLKLLLVSLLSIGIIFLFNYLIRDDKANTISLFFIKGFMSVVSFLLFASIVFYKKTLYFIKRMFDNSFCVRELGKTSVWESLRIKLRPKREKINKCFSLVFIIYFLLNFSLYYLEGIPFVGLISSNIIFQYLVKFVSYAVVLLYSCLFFAANKISIKKGYVVVFCIAFVLSVVSSFVLPNSLTFVATNEYGWQVETMFNIGIIDLAIGNINYLLDLFLTFMFVFVFRQHIRRSDIFTFLKFIIVFSLFEVAYSLVFQYKDYLYFFSAASGNGSFSGYETNLSGTFISKNGFGFLLFQSIISGLYLFVFSTKKKWLYFSSSIFFFLINIFTLCKTAIISSAIAFFILVIALFVKIKSTNRKLFVALIAFSFVIVFAFCLIFTPFARKIPFVDKFASKFIDLFIISGDATIRSRFYIWEYALKLIKGPYIVFGYGRTASAYYLRICSNFITYTFHNGLLDVLCSFGVFGLLVYFISVYHGTKAACLFEKNRLGKALVYCVVIGTLLYGLMENVYLFMTSSSVMLTSNIILSTSSDCARDIQRSSRYEIEI